jgi:hypothetical protein
MAEVDEYFPEDVPPESDPELEQDYTPTEEPVESYSPQELDALAAENGVDAGNESVESYTPEQLDALAAENGVDAGDGGNIPESALYRNEEMNRGINPYNQYDTGTFEGPLFNTSSSQEQVTKALLQQAQNQATLQQRYNQTTRGDWRVRIRLAPGATYLYQDASNQLLAPLRASNGVIFPYTPTIQTSYAANYDKYDLTHSNYRGYFYKNSVVNDISVNATFTAQDTFEAQYLLAVIVFFRSATKMFYGKDEFRGAPPPLVELSGYGEYQYNNHPCLISNFSYSLPNDVDYIQVSPNNQGINLTNRQSQISSTPWSNVISQVIRLSNAMNGGLPRGANYNRGDLGSVGQTVYGTGQTTYVPTKMELQLTLLPVQTRQQVSQQFSVKNFANGNLLKGGFW